MSEQSSVRYGWLVSLVGLLMWGGIAVGLCIAGVGAYLALHEFPAPAPEIGIAMVLIGVFTIPVWIVVYGFLTVLINTEEDLQGVGAALASVAADLRELQRAMEIVGENSLLSESAKLIVGREKDRELLERAIAEDIATRDWESAARLIDQFEVRGGGAVEVRRLREEVRRHESMTEEQQIVAGIRRIEGLLDRYEWDQTRKEIDGLLARFDGDNRLRALPEELDNRREKRKRQLLTEFDQVYRRGDVDVAGGLLRELDPYLTKNETAALEESARGVFRAHLHQLGVQFSLAVSEQNWQKALDTGVELMESYPNSRFAREVRERLDILKQRAAAGNAGAQAAPSPASAGEPAPPSPANVSAAPS